MRQRQVRILTSHVDHLRNAFREVEVARLVVGIVGLEQWRTCFK